MPKVTEAIPIQAPQQQAFDLISDPKRAPTFVPGLKRISNVSAPEPKPGRTWEWEFDWFGLVLSGKTECSRFDSPEWYQFKTLTGAKSTWTYHCEPSDSHSKLTLEIEYEPPNNLLARFASGMLEKMNQDRAHETVANIKALLES